LTTIAKRIEPPNWKKFVTTWTERVSGFLIPLLAVFTALLIGALVIWASGANVLAAYQGLFEGALGSPRGIAETLVIFTPYTLAGLAVALGFRCGLFNIGAEGQFYAGALLAVWVGFGVTGLPVYIHLPLAILAGALGGAIYGAIPGFLKARLGTHEVINTIMMNYIAVRTVDFLVNKRGPLWDSTSSVPRTPYILPTAELPVLFEGYRLHAGLLTAIVAVFVVYWLLWKTTLGFEIRAVGANPTAAKYAGMSVTRNFVLAMIFSGSLAGLAGAGEVLGLNHYLPSAFVSGYGFDSIAIALLAKSHPLFIPFAAFLWAVLRNGASLMQVRAGISVDLINIVQALVIAFVAADEIIRWLYRIRAKEEIKEVVFTRGWGR
jgi:simple sugar transport system permease protein